MSGTYYRSLGLGSDKDKVKKEDTKRQKVR